MKLLKIISSKIVEVKNWFLKASWKKKVATVVVIAGVLYLAISRFTSSGPVYTTESAIRSTITSVVSESGNVTSSGRFDVYSPTTGYINNIFIKNGDVVKQGDNLFEVKSTATDQEKATAYANYQNAVNSKKTAEHSKQTLDATMWTKQQAYLNAQTALNTMNNKHSNSKNNPSTNKAYTDLEKMSIQSAYTQTQKDFNAAEQSYKEADSAITAAGASVNSTWLTYKATQDIIVTAPAPGTIANFSSSVGDKVTAAQTSASQTSASSTSPSLVILGNITKTKIKIPLNEVDVYAVKVGQPATIVFDAYRDKKYKGYVAFIDDAGTNTSGIITYDAIIELDDTDQGIKTEMTATVSIETAKHEHVLSVSNSAVKPYKGSKAVIVLGIDPKNPVKDKTGKLLQLHYVPVKVGLKGTIKTEIIDGITDGTKVVTSSIN